MARSGEAAAAPREVEVHVERRRSPRAPVVVRVEYSTVDAFFSDFSRDLNEGGIFIETDRPLEPESEVHLQFRIPGDDEPLRVRGRVAWSARGGPRSGMGVEFEALPPEARERINDLVRRMRSRP